jgi:hypothetical protein
VFTQDFKQWFVHQWLTSKYPEETGALLLGLRDNAVKYNRVHPAVFQFSGDPAALAVEIAIVSDRNKMKGREKLSLLHPFLESVEAFGPFDSQVKDKFVQALFVCFKQQSV